MVTPGTTARDKSHPKHPRQLDMPDHRMLLGRNKEQSVDTHSLEHQTHGDRRVKGHGWDGAISIAFPKGKADLQRQSMRLAQLEGWLPWHREFGSDAVACVLVSMLVTQLLASSETHGRGNQRVKITDVDLSL